MLDREIVDKHFNIKGYLHFDRRVHFRNVENYVTNPKKIMFHSFLPFLHYVDMSEKFTGKANPKIENRPIKEKKRKIMYAGHLDGYIYKYYSILVNKDYDIWASRHKIDNCSLAYRDNKPRQSNIDFSAEIINKIVCFGNAYVLVGDFTDFFDRLDHRILKNNLIDVLADAKLMENRKLSKDWYNVFRSVTKFGYYDKVEINEICGEDQELWGNKQHRYFKSINELRKYQKEHKAQYNKNSFGIPQGTAISGVLANIYSVNFDLELMKIANQYGGVYNRYSDDFILVIPKAQIVNMGLSEFNEIESEVRRIAKENKIILQEKKTAKYEYDGSKIVNLENQEDSRVDYLGFVFDGKSVRMRGKSPYKFYRNAYDLVRRGNRIKRKKNLKKIPYRKQLYLLYTDLGTELKPYGNFISYAKRSQEKFDELSPKTKNLMMRQIKNRKRKIEKRLGIKLHVKI
ncbi:reverse transcriptase domain-containing protein [Enterococcus sp. BWR-S5]|uniref:reverse transcriptase domain-containing protein n=1 Tax=Enterococcus sp. BWR-S5 TaxID=2787714 RepID=UPI0019226102|nr:reverse transcriptase domain-containing protein [Enterococcus sp. BWR-S5]MBL1225833.1 RNA-dependent DNA polymerase [Enterococcus sp. BWR-S5]